jgi:capsular polysaccharide biosynthesis protein
MSAVLERRPQRLHVGRILLRRGGIVLLAVALVPLAAYFVASGLHRSYTAEALVVVPSGAGPHGPGNAQEADKLAVTYAAVIPEDDRVLDRIARTAGVGTSLVKRELKVVTDEGTSLIRLRFTDDRRDVAVAGARAAAQAVTAQRLVTPSIAPGSIALVRFPTVPDQSSRPATTVPIGIVLGLILGLILLVAWERADARTDDVASLEAETGCPAMRLGDLSTGSMTALLQRWDALAGRSEPRIALVAAAAHAESATVAAAHRLHAAAEMEGMPIAIEDRRAGAADGERPPSRSNGSGDPDAAYGGVAKPGDRTTLVIGGVPGSNVAGEAVALDADFVVLVASPGTRAVDIRAAVAVLEQFGVSPGWALLADRPRTGGALRPTRLDALLGRRREEAARVASRAADREPTKDARA